MKNNNTRFKLVRRSVTTEDVVDETDKEELTRTFNNFRSAYESLIMAVRDDKLHYRLSVEYTLYLSKFDGTLLSEHVFAPTETWQQILDKVERLPMLAETVLVTIHAATAFHDAWYPDTDEISGYMCHAINRLANLNLIHSDVCHLATTYISLMLNMIADREEWVYLSHTGVYCKGMRNFPAESLSLKNVYNWHVKTALIEKELCRAAWKEVLIRLDTCRVDDPQYCMFLR